MITRSRHKRGFSQIDTPLRDVRYQVAQSPGYAQSVLSNGLESSDGSMITISRQGRPAEMFDSDDRSSNDDKASASDGYKETFEDGEQHRDFDEREILDSETDESDELGYTSNMVGLQGREAALHVKIYEQFELSLAITCNKEDHETAYAEHFNTSAPESHGNLASTYKPDANIDDKYARNEYASNFENVLNTSRLPQDLPGGSDRRHYPSAAAMANIFSGVITGESGLVEQHLCLEQDCVDFGKDNVPVDHVYDTDSFFCRLSSLAACKLGVRIFNGDRTSMNIRTDVHFEIEAPLGSGDSYKPRDLPHITIFNVESDVPDFAIHIFFPNLSRQYKSSGKFKALNGPHFQSFMDNILFPAVQETIPSHVKQHLSDGYSHGQTKNRGNMMAACPEKETKTRKNMSFFIPPEYLAAFWIVVVDLSRTFNEGMFADMALVASWKNGKLKGKNIDPVDAWTGFCSHYKKTFDEALVLKDDTYVDIGKEVCPCSSFQVAGADAPATLLPRRCCLQQRLRHLSYNTNKLESHQFYTLCLMRDAQNLAISSEGELKALGCPYVQMYASLKEAYDCGKHMPFEAKSLDEIAADRELAMAYNKRSGCKGDPYGDRIRAYGVAKTSAYESCVACKRNMYGFRIEFRIKIAVLESLLEYYIQTKQKDKWRATVRAQYPPTDVWTFESSKIADYLAGNANKYAAAFEMGRQLCPGGRIPWSRTQLLTMFIQCLAPIFTATNLSRYPGLWKSQHIRQDKSGPWVGLDFCTSLEERGYCYLPEIFNWEEFEFKDSKKILFGHSSLHQSYRVDRTLIYGEESDLETVTKLYNQIHEVHACRIKVYKYLAKECYIRFRQDVYNSSMFKSSIRQNLLDTDGSFSRDVALVYDQIASLMSGPLHLQGGNKTRFKSATQVVELLWGDNTGKGMNRKYFPVQYRRYAQSIDKMVDTAGQSVREWRTVLYEGFVKEHWILPSGDCNGMLFTRKTDKRSGNTPPIAWYSISDEEDGQTIYQPEAPWAGRYHWARTAHKAGLPEPEKTDVDVEQLERTTRNLFSTEKSKLRVIPKPAKGWGNRAKVEFGDGYVEV